MTAYRVTFMGKPKSVKGPEYLITKIVEGKSKWHVLMELYKSYENIHFPQYEPL